MKHASLLAVLLASSACGGDVRLPQPQQPEPIPTPMPPRSVYLLANDDIYAVESDHALTIRALPKGLIEFEPRKPGLYFWKTGGKWVEKEFKGPHVYFGKAVGEGRAECEFFWAEDGEVKSKTALVDCLVAPQPPPVPPKPPEPPKPEPVESFRVIFVYESSDPITPAMQRVMFGQATRNYLDGKTTRHANAGSGWRRWDKDVDATNERDPDIKALWEAAKPKVTTVPCVIVSVNRKADIVPFPADEAAAIELFKKYAEGKQ